MYRLTNEKNFIMLLMSLEVNDFISEEFLEKGFLPSGEVVQYEGTIFLIILFIAPWLISLSFSLTLLINFSI